MLACLGDPRVSDLSLLTIGMVELEACGLQGRRYLAGLADRDYLHPYQ